MTCREKGCYLSCKFLDLCLSKVHRSIQCCCMIFVLWLTLLLAKKRGLCREQWSCGGTGVGDTAQFWLTVSQYVEWGSMRCELLVLFFVFFLLRWFLGRLFFLLLWHEEEREREREGGRKKKKIQLGLDYAHKENASQVPSTFSNNSGDSCLNVTLLFIASGTNLKKHKCYYKSLW